MSRKRGGGVTVVEPPLEGVASNEVRARGRLPPSKYKKMQKFLFFLNFFSKILSKNAYQF